MTFLTYDSSNAVLENACDATAQNNIALKVNPSLENLLKGLLEKGGPTIEDYKNLDRFMEILYLSVQVGLISPEEIEASKRLFSEAFLNETVHGYGYRKPMGYAGDYLMIDKIYTYHQTDKPAYKKWDEYFHHNAATRAVRNRKDYFIKQLLQKIESAESPVNLLNVASGPARDVKELYEKINPTSLHTTCVDIDANAIEYGKNTCMNYLSQIDFYNKNILRFNTVQQFDVIWSAGLFDYFDERVFVLVIKRFLAWLKPGGEIIVGNFSDDNSSRGYMELFGEWYLLHRSKEELIELAMQAGVSRDKITVDQEPLGINLFLRIKG